MSTTYVGLGALAPTLVAPPAVAKRGAGQRRAGLIIAGVGAGVAAVGTVVILHGSSAFAAQDNCGWGADGASIAKKAWIETRIVFA